MVKTAYLKTFRSKAKTRQVKPLKDSFCPNSNKSFWLNDPEEVKPVVKLDKMVDGKNCKCKSCGKILSLRPHPVSSSMYIVPKHNPEHERKYKFSIGDRIVLNDFSSKIHGTVVKAGATVHMIEDGGKRLFYGSPNAFSVSDKPKPEEPTDTSMSNWDICSFKAERGVWREGLGNMNVCQAVLRFKAEAQIKISIVEDTVDLSKYFECEFEEINDGAILQLEKDLSEWAEKQSFCDFDIEDLKKMWLDWYLNRKDFGVLSSDYLYSRFQTNSVSLSVN